VFLAELQHAVRNNNKIKFSSLVQYPVRVFERTYAIKITTRADLIQRYPLIMTSAMKRAILAQSAECLFGNGTRRNGWPWESLVSEATRGPNENYHFQRCIFRRKQVVP
jgi:hypothetical protein